MSSLRTMLKRNLRYLIGDKNIAEFCKRVGGIPKTTVQTWMTSSNGSIRALHHLKKLADYLSRERGRKITVDMLLFEDLEAVDRTGTKDGVNLLESLIGPDGISGVFQVSIKRIGKKEN